MILLDLTRSAVGVAPTHQRYRTHQAGAT